MDITHDPEADAVMIRLAAGEYDESEEVHPGVVLDFDKDGRVLAIEIIPASKVLRAGDWTSARPPGSAPSIAAE